LGRENRFPGNQYNIETGIIGPEIRLFYWRTVFFNPVNRSDYFPQLSFHSVSRNRWTQFPSDTETKPPAVELIMKKIDHQISSVD
jgi:hypothetical protein